MNIQNVKGFNYQPSYGSSGIELWRNFDAQVIARELTLGKEYFPKMQALRWWLSWDAWKRDPARFAADFETALALAAERDLVVMPVLFNRWHDPVCDYGGTYIDHFLPGASYVQSETMFEPFLESIVGAHADDARIFAWDLCNEPFFYQQSDEVAEVIRHEYLWLEKLYRSCKRLGARAPITVGVMCARGAADLEQVEAISDFFSFHPYWTYDSPPHEQSSFEERLDAYAEFARRSGKELLATETCWGHVVDAKRVEIIRYTLGELQKRNIGWLTYSLYHSLIADLHREEFGPMGAPGNLSFIEADGSLRPGHEVWNEFT